ncbi:MAG: hypothetical protein GWO11_06845 [Desulfuromonadales bacterium]|nr:hypothetical protein [Desulfuromonadales bacterium]NIR34064.1 hypothetical protein [Desulfuromonadales bacterium]NIS44115.1 hypothetical protein [Desulfuromonadales bacterium]
MSRTILIALLMVGLFGPGLVWAGEDNVATLWPVFDYRTAPAVDYKSFNLAGPLVTWQKKGSETEFGLRPLYYKATDPETGRSYSEVLYPLLRKEEEPGQSRLTLLQLFTYDLGSRDAGSSRTFTLFPFIFGGDHEAKGRYFAFFPFGGKMYDRFGREEIRFALFPIYGKTLKKGTEITNILWPIFARIDGPAESGIKVWPLFGKAQKEGVYRKLFILWPIYFKYRLKLDTANPVHKNIVFPFYLEHESPQETRRTVLWPFFNYRDDRVKDYRQWDYPWPLFRTTVGQDYHGQRLLPFFADETRGETRKRWYLWPIYKINETQTDVFQQRRHRVLFFLYRHMTETRSGEEGVRKRRISFWPLFTYDRIKGVSHFRTLSILEPIFPENEPIKRNWEPLWRLYQKKWDKHGSSVTSVLWNLYWSEKREGQLAWELFPLVSYFREEDTSRDVSILKGLIRFRSDSGKNVLSFLYLPWGITWAE